MDMKSYSYMYIQSETICIYNTYNIHGCMAMPVYTHRTTREKERECTVSGCRNVTVLNVNEH